MTVTNKIKLDLLRPNFQTLSAKQLDSVGRVVDIELIANGAAWIPPDSISNYVVQYRKKDGTKGYYTQLPDGTAAVTAYENILTVNLAPQMFTCAGMVSCSVAMMEQDGVLQTFSFFVAVEPSEAVGATSTDYFNFPTLENIGMSLKELTERLEEVESSAKISLELKDFATALSNHIESDALGLPVYDPVAEGDFVSMMIQRGADEPDGKIVHVLSEEATKEAIAEEVGKRTTLTASDYAQGYFQRLTGIVTSDYHITTHTPQAVKRGEKVSVTPNGNKVTLSVLDSSDLSVAAYLGTPETETTEDMTYIPENDGYLLVQINNPYKITPETNTSVITIGENRIDVLEKEAQTLRETVETIPTAALSMSAKHKATTKIVNDCQAVDKWIVTNATEGLVAVDTENYILWSQSLRCDKTLRCVKDSYDLLNNNLVLRLRINSMADNSALYMRLSATATPSNGLVFCLMRDDKNAPIGQWIEIEIPWNAYSYVQTEAPDISAINDIMVYVYSGAVDFNLQFVGLRPKRLQNGVVSFTFDDGYKSQYTGAKILAEKGITSTVYHIHDATSDQYLTVAELQEMVDYFGTDIEAHGNPTYDTLTEDELVAHWTEAQSFLRNNGLSEGKHLAYPGGRHPANVVKLARRFFTSCRTINSFVPLESLPSADNYRLRAVSGVGAHGSYTVEKVNELIDRAVESDSWLILVFHRIGDGSDTMYCSEDDLATIADYAIASGAKIMNVSEVFDSTIRA